MTKAKFERCKQPIVTSTISHVDHGKSSLLAAISKALAPPPSMPDRVAVWSWDAFMQTLQAAQGVVLANPTLKQHDEFMGLRIFVDPTLAPNTIELRCGKEVVRVINVQT